MYIMKEGYLHANIFPVSMEITTQFFSTTIFPWKIYEVKLFFYSWNKFYMSTIIFLNSIISWFPFPCFLNSAFL